MPDEPAYAFDHQSVEKLAADHRRLKAQVRNLEQFIGDAIAGGHSPSPPLLGVATGSAGTVSGTHKFYVQNGAVGSEFNEGSQQVAAQWLTSQAPSADQKALLFRSPHNASLYYIVLPIEQKEDIPGYVEATPQILTHDSSGNYLFQTQQAILSALPGADANAPQVPLIVGGELRMVHSCAVCLYQGMEIGFSPSGVAGDDQDSWPDGSLTISDVNTVGRTTSGCLESGTSTAWDFESSSSQYFTVSDRLFDVTQSNWAVAMWVKPETSASGKTLMEIRDSTARLWAASVNVSVGLTQGGKKTTFVTLANDTTNALSNGTCHLCWFYRDGDTFGVQLDDNAPVESTNSNAWDDDGATYTTTIGYQQGTGIYFDGTMEAVVVWNRTPSEAERDTVYEQTIKLI